jgi:hypothetical protein
MMVHAGVASVQLAYRSKAAHRRLAVQVWALVKKVMAVIGVLALIAFGSWVVVMSIAAQEETEIVRQLNSVSGHEAME